MALSARPKKKLLSLFSRKCPGCGASIELGSSILCRWCALRVYPDGERIIHGKRILTGFHHSGVLREMILRLKFGGERKLAGIIAELAVTGWKAVPRRGDIVIPVPSTAGRMRQRGYNQTRLIAGRVASLTGAVCMNLLLRSRGESQVGLSAEDRSENIKGKFSFAGKRALPNRTWLIDDVMTTGATILECIAVLEDAGVKNLTPAVVCFRKPEDESIIQVKEVNHGGV